MLMEREDAQAEVNARTAIHYLIRLLLSKDRSMITCHLANVLKAFIKKKKISENVKKWPLLKCQLPVSLIIIKEWLEYCLKLIRIV